MNMYVSCPPRVVGRYVICYRYPFGYPSEPASEDVSSDPNPKYPSNIQAMKNVLNLRACGFFSSFYRSRYQKDEFSGFFYKSWGFFYLPLRYSRPKSAFKEIFGIIFQLSLSYRRRKSEKSGMKFEIQQNAQKKRAWLSIRVLPLCFALPLAFMAGSIFISV